MSETHGSPDDRIDFLDELSWRGLVYQCTDEQGLRAHLADPSGTPRRAYAGFDPTANSLTIGNLVPIMALAHLARAGHEPIVVAGGGTGLIGDPSGKSGERGLMTQEQVASNVESQRGIFERVFAGAGFEPPRVENNLEWLGSLGYIEVLRSVGKHFSVNQMIQKDSVRERLETREQGISYTEFSYMVLQAYDFLHLNQREGVTVQIGGSDQWGNIVAGLDLIGRSAQAEVFGLTVPLITKADGGKFGKTESGAVWLSADRTSPYAYYQFWLNADDADVPGFLRVFTLLDRERIEELETEHERNPGARPAHRALAHAAPSLLHGSDAEDAAEAASRALFSGEIASLDEPTLREVFAEVPSSTHHRTNLAGEGVDLVGLLVEVGLASSKREAREFVQNGSVLVNGARAQPGRHLETSDLLQGGLIAIRRGKKQWHLTEWR